MSSLVNRIKNKLDYSCKSMLRPSIVMHNGVKLNLNSSCVSEKIRKNIYKGFYELNEVNIIKTTLEKSDKVLELGTGMGFVSIYCAQQIGSENVFTYEANEVVLQLAEENFKANNVSPRSENKILSLENVSSKDFYHAEDFWDSTTHAIKSDNKITVPIENFNEVVKKIKPTYLIMDIEGGESELFLNPAIDLSGINKICIEIHPRIIGNDKCSGIIHAILSKGFTLNFDHFSKVRNLYFERLN